MKHQLEATVCKSEDHHWWPRCLSKHWKDKNGYVHRLSSDGVGQGYKKLEKIGYITDAHSIRFADKPTDWDQCFESYFSSVDNNKGFGDIVTWLKGIKNTSNSTLEEQANLDNLLQCVLSLVVRSPRFRNGIKLSIEAVGAASEEKLINLNQRDTFGKFKSGLLGRGKFAIVFSREKEFVFGDGFYNNFTTPINIPIEPRVIVPILPDVCVFYSRPAYYKTQPRMITINLDGNDVDFINQTTMVYSKSQIFYRSQQPAITEEFSCGRFLEYSVKNDPVVNAFSRIFNRPRSEHNIWGSSLCIN